MPYSFKSNVRITLYFKFFLLKMRMFSYICKNCGKTEQFSHYPLATIKLIEKYTDGVIENIEEQNIYLKTYYNSYGRFIPLLGELDEFPDCDIKG